ncbi:MAG: SIS domain-containing protein [Chitinivibrionales bacterium]|nr:SIS domain-containing protein [Chitinivibrionales bacterium]MBD3396319.1 SIS domain-containing protein [Chitinivibrionales bacterium]
MKTILERAREILQAEADAIRDIPLNASFEDAVDALFHCSGKVVTTGMGKAGNVAMKMASTLCSTGTPAAYLHPGESAHGELGLATHNDVIVAFSTSGKTREVLEMLGRARRLGVASVVAITSHADAAIREIADVVIDMGTIEEPCSLGLTPTASTAAMLAVSDAVCLVLMEKKGLSREDYGLRHHGGYLGEKARNSAF